MKLETARQFLEHAPAAVPALNPDLVGFLQKEDWFLCEQCAGRITGRGCKLEGSAVYRADVASTDGLKCGTCGTMPLQPPPDAAPKPTKGKTSWSEFDPEFARMRHEVSETGLKHFRDWHGSKIRSSFRQQALFLLVENAVLKDELSKANRTVDRLVEDIEARGEDENSDSD